MSWKLAWYAGNTFFFNLFFLYSRFLLVIYFIHISEYMSIPISQFITPPLPFTAFPPWCPYVCSLHLCLNFCPANRFICTIFLGSTYICRKYFCFSLASARGMGSLFTGLHRSVKSLSCPGLATAFCMILVSQRWPPKGYHSINAASRGDGAGTQPQSQTVLDWSPVVSEPLPRI